MEDSCCIGLNLKQRCTDREGKIIKIDIDDLSLVEVELLYLDHLFMNLTWSEKSARSTKINC